MKLISCYIAHFGKISEFEYKFNDGFNSILQENGWGKTTFSVFIKAMFYGLEYSPNTKKKLLERNHYLPWDGSLCGGNIVFSTKDRRYRIERTFGRTDKDDTFALYDDVTGMISTDYTEDIGEELFRVDRDSFEKSVYIPQLAIATAMTDSLNAKMGNLTAARDDISNFDVALKSVKDARVEYTRNSKINPGKLYETKLEINKCKEEYEKLPHIEESVEAMSCLVEEKQDSLDKLNNQKAKLADQIQLQSKREQELGAYKIHKENLLSEQEKIAELDEFFAAGLPSDDEIIMLEQTERDLAVHERALKAFEEAAAGEPPVFKQPFEIRIPDESEFAMWNKMAANLSELRAKAEHSRLSEESSKLLTELKFFFDKLVPTDEQLSHMERQTTLITGLEARISQSNERLIGLRAEQEVNEKLNKEKNITVWHILGTILLILLIVTGVVFSNYLGNKVGRIVEIISFVAAILDVALLLITGRRAYLNKRRQAADFQDRIEEEEEELELSKLELRELQEECEEFLSHFLLTRASTMQENVYEIRRKLDQYRHLTEEENSRHQEAEGTLDELADLQLELYTKIQPFASCYGINLYDMGGEYEFLAKLKKDADRYTKYLEQQEEITSHQNSIKTMSEDIERVIKRFPVDESLRRAEAIQSIGIKKREYEAIASRINELKDEIAKFETAFDVNEDVQSVDDLQQQQNALDEQIMDLNKQIMQEKENLSTALEEVERLSDIAEQIERLEVTEKEYKKEAEILSMTEDFLQRARESFQSKYMQPLQNGLHKYLSLINGPEGTKSGYAIEDFELDMDLNIKLTYSGSTKGAEYLSQGYQDLVALCSRLALVDVLYPEEKPILILDDPFTNLDDKKIKESLKLLHKIADDRQTVYFTCHDSRL
ncbi:MAG: AAA family ATPase [Pseudobutyrivibrio sp.]|nr:AAA family ATPase [Pseudobutyrivibrio sp.]